MIDYHQLIVDFLDGTILNRRQLAEAIGGHPLYPEQPPGDYRAAKGILNWAEGDEPAEKAIRRIRDGEDSDLQAENAALKEVLTALLENWSSYLDADSAGKCGHYCDHCEDYFDPDDSRIPKRPHAPDCPVARAQELLR